MQVEGEQGIGDENFILGREVGVKDSGEVDERSVDRLQHGRSQAVQVEMICAVDCILSPGPDALDEEV